MARATLLLVLLVLPASARAARGPEIERALEDLSSPFEEARRQAVRTLGQGGAEAVRALVGAYPGADFRTKALVLDALGVAGDPAGLGLVRADLLTSDRGVVRAQKDYLSALFAAVRDEAAREIAPGFGEDWRAEEAIRCLPAPVPSSREALAAVADSGSERARAAAERIAVRTAALDGFREWLDVRSGAGDGPARARCGALAARLLRHDVERTMLAVHEAGSEGFYDGMYARAGELVAGAGEAAVRVLARIVRDEPWPESGIPGPPDDRYRNLEPIPRDLGRLGVRQVAAQCLGDVGGGYPEVAADLAEWLRAKGPDYDEIDNVDYPLALALAGLGEKGPIEEAMRHFVIQIGSPRTWDLRWERCMLRLAGCHGKLGEYEEAASVYRRFLRITGQSDPVTHYNMACVLAKSGRTREALGFLSRAVENGYGGDPSQIVWLERDGDLENLRDEPEYQRLLERARRR